MERKNDFPLLTAAMITGKNLARDNELKGQVPCHHSQQASHLLTWKKNRNDNNCKELEEGPHSRNQPVQWENLYGLKWWEVMVKVNQGRSVSTAVKVSYVWHVPYSCRKEGFCFLVFLIRVAPPHKKSNQLLQFWFSWSFKYLLFQTKKLKNHTKGSTATLMVPQKWCDIRQETWRWCHMC